MDARQLRVGNYVFDEHNDIKIVYGISHLEGYDVAYVHFKNEFDKPATFTIQPIPITQEWLINFGFKKRKVQVGYNWTCGITIKEWEDGSFLYSFDSTSVNHIDIRYVHQLQNLYYILTGKELIIK